jgi:hypothetical protein
MPEALALAISKQLNKRVEIGWTWIGVELAAKFCEHRDEIVNVATCL